MKKARIMLAILAITAVVIVLGIVIYGQLTPSDAPVAGDEGTFPKLTGTNLSAEEFTIPDDLPGALRLIVVSYDRDQQDSVDEWLLPLEELNENHPNLNGFYVPLLPQSAADTSALIIGGMRIAVADDRDRARTIIVFTDVEAFNQILDIPGVDALQLFLLDESGAILWRGSGNYDPATLESLENVLNRRD